VGLIVLKPGMLTTIQDLGRWGYQSCGVPVAGPMDSVSHRLANALVGNDRDAASLEITLLGPELEFETERVAAVTGAEFTITVDGKSVPMNAAFVVAAGARLRFGARTRGARAYLAIEGGIDAPRVLGSRSTHVISAMGGMSGRALRPGDRLPIGARPRARRAVALSADDLLPPPDHRAFVRVLPGPQRERFSSDAIDTLQSAPYKLGANSDRMGFRLQGPGLHHVGSPDIISDATPVGTLQVPASGQPILLMADRQTTGGYPKIATAITADLPAAAQLAPGDEIQFAVCSPREAMAALIAQERMLLHMEAR
jgi:antagonist of KipI